MSLRRAARLGDGFVFGHAGERARQAIGRLHELLDEQGRDSSRFGFEGLVDYVSGPDQLAADVEAWRSAGGTHLSVRVMDSVAEFMGIERYGYVGVDDRIEAARRFWELAH